MDAFDADALIYAATPGHAVGRRVLPLLMTSELRVGSVLLLPELLSRPLRQHGADSDEVHRLARLLGRLELLPADAATARLATTLGARHRLRAADALHLATAVTSGADRFITNNRKDFRSDIEEIDVVHADALPDPGAGSGPR